MEMTGAMRLITTYAPDEDSSHKSHADAWQCIVADYSARFLTKSSDKLPAIAGLAQAFATFHHLKSEDHLAGLWKENLLDDLL
jgi:hypothetical protein